MSKKEIITVKGTEITVISDKKDDYISLSDMAGYKDELEARVVVSNWMSTRFTLEFLGIWEEIYNPNFNRMEYHTIKNADGRLVLTPKRWVERTNATGIFSKSGRYGGGIFAHRDIAFEFGSWLSAEFKFYLIKEFQRLKEDEIQQKSLEWNLQRTLSKINYRIHTDAIKDEIIPKEITKDQAKFIYADEADLLNVALFGKTAKQWRQENHDKEGNIRDYATLEQLVVLSNMEMLCKPNANRTCSSLLRRSQHSRKKSINALLIRQGLPQGERLVQLNATAITQMRSLVENKNFKMLK